MRHSGGLSERMRVAVLCGGWSRERGVSLKSGEAIINAINKIYEVVAIDPVKDLTRFAAQIVSARPDVIINALHGTGGEDGIIAGALELSGIPYTHSGVEASAIAMDKKLTKIVAAAIGIRVAEDVVIQRRELAKGNPLQPPYVVKPINEGSSIGVTIVQNDPTDAINNGEPDQLVLIEKYIPGQELTVSVLETANGLEALGITRLQPANDFYDYKAKYTAGITDHQVNPDLPPAVQEELKSAALKIHKTLGCRGVSRSDFRYNETDGVVFLEINTHPGMTDLSLVPEQAAAKGIAFDRLVVTLIESALSRASVTEKVSAA
jgi:D-alanine-D-alanine ligase